MAMYYLKTQVNDFTKQSYVLMTSQGSMLVQQRHSLVERALRQNPTHILFIDSDMEFPADTLNRLLAADKDIVGANCTTRAMPPEPTAHDLSGERISSLEKNPAKSFLCL